MINIHAPSASKISYNQSAPFPILDKQHSDKKEFIPHAGRVKLSDLCIYFQNESVGQIRCSTPFLFVHSFILIFTSSLQYFLSSTFSSFSSLLMLPR
mmetsp:Transcript_17432/g.25937  ORF Transcript_17432/g.25937 Transcript_17432/m.25937 type:complete len:97 (-) Transcript_17432:1198-1488(-)